MKSREFAMFVVLVACIGFGSVPGSAQTTDPEARGLISDPLENYTLDVMIPARSADEVSAMLTVAKSWVNTSDRYKANTKKARELVKTRLSVKQQEIKTLEAQIKAAKKSGDSAEADRLKTEVKIQKNQADALKKIQAYSGEWDDHANALENAGKAWIAFLETEEQVGDLRGQAAKRAKKSDDPLSAGAPTPEDFKAHKKYVDAVKKHGDSMEALGKSIKQLADSAQKVLSDWEDRNPMK
jgi:septal ring factor EnvC (AmiA/AmiB activator)